MKTKFSYVGLVVTGVAAAMGCSSGLPNVHSDGGRQTDSASPDVEAAPDVGPGDANQFESAADASVPNSWMDASETSLPDVGTETGADSGTDANDATLPLEAASDAGLESGMNATSDSGDGSSPDSGDAGLGLATSVSARVIQSCARTSNSNIACWNLPASPTQVTTLIGDVAQVSSGGAGEGVIYQTYLACAVTTLGGVWCWGSNTQGDLGNGIETPSSVPVPVSGLASGVAAVSAGPGGSACAVTASGNIWCWGDNTYNELGNGTSATYSAVPVQVTGFTSAVTAVSVGNNAACAITTGGGVECWGTNTSGQLGNNFTTNSTSPVQVSGLTSGATAVSVGNSYACAVVSGGVQCWGNNSFGQTLVPTAVTGLASGVTSVSVGSNSACAVVNGAVQCWGSNAKGELGNGSTTDSAIPVPVMTLATGATSVSVGYQFACALTSSTGVWCWGYNIATEFPYVAKIPVHVTN